MVFGIEEAYRFEAHLAAKDGGELPVATCPECGEETCVFSEGGCAICDFEMPDDATCAVCGEKLTLDDLGEGTVSAVIIVKSPRKTASRGNDPKFRDSVRICQLD
jgi:ribosomal protein S27E